MSSESESIIEQARQDLHSVEVFRANERGAARPGDPDRQRRIDDQLARMLGYMTPVRSLLARAQWDDDLLTVAQRDEIDEISRGFQLARRQLKKMR